MPFDGPQSTDYENVASLNRAYLSILCRDSRSHAGLAHLSPALYGRLTELTIAQAERLSGAPFLLMSFREQDDHLCDLATVIRQNIKGPPLYETNFGRGHLILLNCFGEYGSDRLHLVAFNPEAIAVEDHFHSHLLPSRRGP